MIYLLINCYFIVIFIIDLEPLTIKNTINEITAISLYLLGIVLSIINLRQLWITGYDRTISSY